MAEEQTLESLRDNYSLKPGTSFGNATSFFNDVYGFIQEGRKNLIAAAQNREENDQSDKLVTIDQRFKNLIDLERKMDQQKQAIETLKSQIDNGEVVTDPVAHYETLLHQIAQEDETKTDEEKYYTNHRYIQFRQTIWSIKHPDEEMPSLVSNDDDDIVMGPTKISLKCPLTTTWFEEPVTNTPCRHTFSKRAIYGLLRSGGSRVCPIPGCDKTVSTGTLVPDPVMADRVARVRAREEESANATKVKLNYKKHDTNR
ncbi:zinc-finger of the MIZ type in Nse subunit-domain-containing protein [Mycotypha africana]|uniref:zinc-finger of the MIZ type in Nse subunit-domain-containing protein n=1 Tax=Mycotypha africana TaxID=64632 RepID=UPI0023002A35|nr:zinc-finger of the MIZ type in Nse subunit-domain-containing protein [Mycotypha africana]KAI8968032.1 zinc-finger of the MIZ type in Nse subunit-domain-containing protein [Mycotypha africana]